ncbi:unnamed protein product, partial [marine sediment metagenome]
LDFAMRIIMGFEYMANPIEKVMKDHNSFKVGKG